MPKILQMPEYVLNVILDVLLVILKQLVPIVLLDSRNLIIKIINVDVLIILIIIKEAVLPVVPFPHIEMVLFVHLVFKDVLDALI